MGNESGGLSKDSDSFLFLAAPRGMRDLSSPTQGLNLCPLQWKCGVLTTGPPGSPRILILYCRRNGKPVSYEPSIHPPSLCVDHIFMLRL